MQELFQLLMRRLFDPNFGMFVAHETTRLYWFRGSSVDMHMEVCTLRISLTLALSELCMSGHPRERYSSQVRSLSSCQGFACASECFWDAHVPVCMNAWLVIWNAPASLKAVCICPFSFCAGFVCGRCSNGKYESVENSVSGELRVSPASQVRRWGFMQACSTKEAHLTPTPPVSIRAFRNDCSLSLWGRL